MYFFRQITTIIKVRVSFVFGLHTIKLIDFTKAIQLNGLKPKNKGHTNFYECCDLTKKVYLIYMFVPVLVTLESFLTKKYNYVGTSDHHTFSARG